MPYPLTVMMIPGSDDTNFRVVFSRPPARITGHFTPSWRLTRAERSLDWQQPRAELIRSILSLDQIRSLDIEPYTWTLNLTPNAVLTRAKVLVAQQISRGLNCSVASDDGYGYHIGAVQFLRPASLNILLIKDWPDEPGHQYFSPDPCDLAISFSPDGQPKVIASALGLIADVKVVVDDTRFQSHKSPA